MVLDGKNADYSNVDAGEIDVLVVQELIQAGFENYRINRVLQNDSPIEHTHESAERVIDKAKIRQEQELKAKAERERIEKQIKINQELRENSKPQAPEPKYES